MYVRRAYEILFNKKNLFSHFGNYFCRYFASSNNKGDFAINENSYIMKPFYIYSLKDSLLTVFSFKVLALNADVTVIETDLKPFQIRYCVKIVSLLESPISYASLFNFDFIGNNFHLVDYYDYSLTVKERKELSTIYNYK